MPESFGLSVSISNEPEEIEGKKFIRCAEIYSADLVDGPAANPGGLFSKPEDSQQHKMSTENTTLTLEQISAQVVELKKAMEGVKPTDLSGVTADITAAKTELAKLTAAASAAAEAAKKTEIGALVAEASRDGKVIPLTDVQLSKMEVADIKEMISKLPKTISLAKKQPAAPKVEGLGELTLEACRDANGNFDRAKMGQLRQFCADRRAAGAEALNLSLKDN